MSGAISVAAYTLGCKVNQCDTDAILGLLSNIGCVICNFNEEASIYIINTCTVTHASDKKSRQVIRRTKKANPNAFIAVCGCLVNKTPEAVHDVDFIFDSRKPGAFVAKVAEMVQLAGRVTQNARIKTRTRAFVKIQDGCDRFCSYCIVPYVRGAPVSRPVQDIEAEIQARVSGGTQEIVLTGIQVASYGEDTKDTTLAAFIRRLITVEGLKRLRLSSLEPCAITDEFLDIIKSSDILCPHFHLSLQSGSDTCLKRMNRRYTTAQYVKIVANIRAICPSVAMTTDVIVGFPGETDEEFAQTMAFVQQIGFARIHVFEYSKREGTPAASAPNQVAEIIKTQRSKQLRSLAETLQINFYKLQIGTVADVLFETQKAPTNWVGHTGNYCQVQVSSGKNLHNTIKQVEITGYNQDGLLGNII